MQENIPKNYPTHKLNSAKSDSFKAFQITENKFHKKFCPQKCLNLW